jgi:hypothetical protein
MPVPHRVAIRAVLAFWTMASEPPSGSVRSYSGQVARCGAEGTVHPATSATGSATRGCPANQSCRPRPVPMPQAGHGGNGQCRDGHRRGRGEPTLRAPIIRLDALGSKRALPQRVGGRTNPPNSRSTNPAKVIVVRSLR